MQGHLVTRKAGWDTHGLPVEIEVEKELKLKGKKAIEAYGVEKFNAKARESVFRYQSDWERSCLKGRHGAFQLVEAIGFATPDSALLLQSTIGVLMQHQQRFTQDLYRRLFALAPAAKQLFHGDMDNQGRMLAHMMQFLVHALSRPDFMTLGLRDLGRRHDGYGVTADFYPQRFAEAFLESARGVLRDRHTAQVEKAWADTLDMIIDAMHGPVAV